VLSLACFFIYLSQGKHPLPRKTGAQIFLDGLDINRLKLCMAKRQILI
jgi:hypothetical protein